jgi:hypothetical protein
MTLVLNIVFIAMPTLWQGVVPMALLNERKKRRQKLGTGAKETHETLSLSDSIDVIESDSVFGSASSMEHVMKVASWIILSGYVLLILGAMLSEWNERREKRKKG